MDSWMFVAAVCLILVMVGVFIAKRVKRYRRLFDPSHFKEVYEKFGAALGRAQDKIDASKEPNLTDGTAFVTEAGLAIAVTAKRHEGAKHLHVSISQAGEGYTTSAVASRFGFFLVTVLNENKMSLTPFLTPSRVHHLVFTNDAETMTMLGFDEAMEHYLKNYRPISYVLLSE